MEYCHAQKAQDVPDTVELFMVLYTGSLQSFINRNDNCRREQDFLAKVLLHTLKGLKFIADKGIIHRDIKPGNIFYLERPDGKRQFVIADFGISKNLGEAKTLGCGTDVYMAPEMFKDAVQTSKVDVYSLGITMLILSDVNKCSELKLRPAETRWKKFAMASTTLE